MHLTEATKGFEIYMLAAGRSPHTVQLHKYTIRRLAEYLNDPDVTAITTADLQAFLAYWGQSHASSSVRRFWTGIRSFFRWAASEFNILNPSLAIPAPKSANRVIHPLTHEEISKLLDACSRTAPANTQHRRSFTMPRSTAKRDRALILLLLDTGIRISEAARLTLGDVDLDNGEIIIRPYGSGEKSRARVLPIGNRTRRALWHYIASRTDTKEDPDPDSLSLFVDKTEDHALDRHGLRQLLNRLGERASVPNVHPHRFRHTFAIEYLRNNGDVFTLQRILGHRTLTMVERYLEIAQADVKTAHRRASPVDRWRL